MIHPDTVAARASIAITNRQRARKVNISLLRRLACRVLEQQLPGESFIVGICLVTRREITRVNQEYLRHEGSTDVITFDYGEARPGRHRQRTKPEQPLHGEILICVEEAIEQAERFQTTWTHELARYVIHGILHLLGFDDRRAAAGRRMKREEERLLKQMAAELDLNHLQGRGRGAKGKR